MKLNVNIDSVTRPSALFILFCFSFSYFTMDLWRGWHFDQTNFEWDVANFYSYLPAKFCNNNSFNFNNGVEGFLPDSPKGEKIPKMTYGMSVMYSPFFALGYSKAVKYGEKLDGFSEPFRKWIHWGCVFYGLLGLVFLRKFLLKFYNEWVVTIVLAVCFFGTNLLYYTLGNSEMSHGSLFLLISIFLLTVYNWHNKPTIINSVLIGLLLGLITLMRPTEIFVALIFVFWKVGSVADLKEQVNKFKIFKWHLLLIAVMFFLLWLPQLLFWKEKTGSFFYFSYVGERFYWSDPQIINILFSYRKGWITYSPLIALVFIGFFFMKDEVKRLRPVLICLLIINIYVLSCWWNWFFGGGFGGRCFSHHIAYLSLPIAAFCNYFVNSERIKENFQFVRAVFFIIIFSGISLSIGQTYQYVKGFIHYDSMSKEAYWHVLGKYHLSGESEERYWKSLNNLDNNKLISGEDRDQ